MKTSRQKDEGEASRRFRAELDETFRGALMSYFSKRVSNRSEAEDLTQEVFVRLLAKAEAPIETSVRPYVFTVAANLLRDRQRRATTHRASAHVTLDDEKAPVLVEDRGPERVLLGKEDLDGALAALDRLGEKTRDIFILFRVERMRQRDIAVLFDISVSTVEKHIMKAMSCLGAHFADENEDR